MLGLQRMAERAGPGPKSRPVSVKPPTRTGEVWDTVKLVYCHEALALRTKMEKAGYSAAAVVPWDEDSDTDSDHSEDEDFSALMV